MPLSKFWFLFIRFRSKQPHRWLEHLSSYKKSIYKRSLMIWFFTFIAFVGYEGFFWTLLFSTIHFFSLFLLETYGFQMEQKREKAKQTYFEDQKRDRESFRDEFIVAPVQEPFTIRECLLLLELEPSTSDFKTIKKQYRKLAKMHHPDMSEGDAARFIEIQHAYSKLEELLLP